MHTEVRCGVLPPKSTGVSLSMNVEPVVQLGYLIGHAEAHNWVILSCWDFVMLGSCLACSKAQLGYFMRSTQLGYFVMLGSSLTWWQ